LAGFKRTSFLKRQKEQKRLAKAAKKREEKEARKQAKALGLSEPEVFEPLDDSDLGLGEEEAPEDGEEEDEEQESREEEKVHGVDRAATDG
jgi:hypothetical protein